MTGGRQEMVAALGKKQEGQAKLDRRLQTFFWEHTAQDVFGWAMLRWAQADLHMGCSFDELRAPRAFSEQLKALFYEQTKRNAIAHLEGAAKDLRKLTEMKIPLWSEQAAFIYEQISPFREDSCAATAEFWLPAGRLLGAERFAKEAEDCRGGSAAACQNALFFASGEEAGEFWARSCRLAVEHCEEAAHYLVEAGEDPAVIAELLVLGCQGGDRSSCLLEAAHVQPKLHREYQARCTEGDFLSCLHFVKATAEHSLPALNQFCTDLPGAPDSPKELKIKCGDAGDPLACVALGARAFQQHLAANLEAPRPALPDDTDAPVEPLWAEGEDIRDEIWTTWLKDFQTWCDAGDLDSCLEAGDLLAWMGQNPTAHYEAACDAGSGEGCFLLAEAIDDKERQSGLYEAACANEYFAACLALATELIDAPQEGEFHREIMNLLQPGCTDQKSATCFALARYMEKFDRGPAYQRCSFLYDGLACAFESSSFCEFLIP